MEEEFSIIFPTFQRGNSSDLSPGATLLGVWWIPATTQGPRGGSEILSRLVRSNFIGGSKLNKLKLKFLNFFWEGQWITPLFWGVKHCKCIKCMVILRNFYEFLLYYNSAYAAYNLFMYGMNDYPVYLGMSPAVETPFFIHVRRIAGVYIYIYKPTIRIPY